MSLHSLPMTLPLPWNQNGHWRAIVPRGQEREDPIMNVRNRITTGVAALALARGLAGGLAATSGGAPSAPAATPASSASSTMLLATAATAVPAKAAITAAGGTAPACIHRYVHGQTARITNKCGKTMWIKVKIHRHPDTHCTPVKNRHSVTFWWSYG